MNEDYVRGFMDKCAAAGVDAEELAKAAEDYTQQENKGALQKFFELFGTKLKQPNTPRNPVARQRNKAQSSLEDAFAFASNPTGQ